MEIIPAVDIRRGRCVRLYQGDPEKETVFSDDPQAMAERWCSEGASRVHVVDLDGAMEGRPVNRQTVVAIAESVAVPVQVGGGIRTDDHVATYLESGVQRVILGTRALEAVDWLGALCERFPGRIAASVDAREGKVSVRGWRETSSVDPIDLAKRLRGLGLGAVIFTDISRDGTLRGPNLRSMSEFAEALDVPVIAAGGIGSLADVAALAKLPISGIVIGRALYSGDVSLPEAIDLVRDVSSDSSG